MVVSAKAHMKSRQVADSFASPGWEREIAKATEALSSTGSSIHSCFAIYTSTRTDKKA